MHEVVDTLQDLQRRVVEASSRVLGTALIHQSTDDELAQAVTIAGDIARLVEALLVEGVGEIADRSHMRDVGDRLTTRMGAHNVNELVRRLTRCAGTTAGRLEKASRAVRAEWDPFEVRLRPAALPALRSALLEGAVGVDGVLAVAGPMLEMCDRVQHDRVLLADEVLADHARGDGPDEAPPACADVLRLHAQVWATALDQDGAEPRDAEAASRRGITTGQPRGGLVPIRGNLLPDVAAQFQRILESTGWSRTVRFDTDVAATENVGILDDRTSPQRAHDAFALALDVAARSQELPMIGGAAPTLVVSVRAEDLASGEGWAFADGSPVPLALAAARQVACSGVVQRVALGGNGRILRLGTEERVFNRHQRRAITLRDGGCIIPGCGVPAAWCQIHHVIAHADGGPTHTENGVLVCWWHHRFIDSEVWQIRMNRGVPEVRPPSWFDRTRRWRTVTTSRTRMLKSVINRT